MALVNSMAENAFAMRYEETQTVVFRKPILTTKDPGPGFGYSLMLANYTTSSQVCNAYHLRAFKVRLQDGPKEEYIRKLWDAKLTFMVDGEKLVKEARFKDVLSKGEVVFEKKKGSVLFHASTIDVIGTFGKPMQDLDVKWSGYMLPNGSRLSVSLSGVPDGGGLVMIETQIDLASYTTRAEVIE